MIHEKIFLETNVKVDWKQTVEESRARVVSEFIDHVCWDELGMQVKIIWGYGHTVVCKYKLTSDILQGDDKNQAELIVHAPVLS